MLLSSSIPFFLQVQKPARGPNLSDPGSETSLGTIRVLSHSFLHCFPVQPYYFLCFLFGCIDSGIRMTYPNHLLSDFAMGQIYQIYEMPRRFYLRIVSPIVFSSTLLRHLYRKPMGRLSKGCKFVIVSARCDDGGLQTKRKARKAGDKTPVDCTSSLLPTAILLLISAPIQADSLAQI